MNAQELTITGVTLALGGALVFIYRDLRSRQRTYAELLYGFRRREAWIGLPLIVVGAVLQLLGVVLS